MPAYYAAADVALARSGALTCTELLATATPAILVPSPNVAADHQTTNARALEQVGAAIVVPEPKVSDELLPALLSLLENPQRRNALSAAAAAVEQVDAADRIAERALDLALLRARGRAINV
jgi:UDP-N-acetylglucosamine--N-acetylmuramyl-(pentapeptide) pyrophosphoryl-undecaprenol N-acetylglucosamine transferase